MMRYFDKNAGRVVVLVESQTDYLMLTEPGDAEAAAGVFRQTVFDVTPSTNNDGVFALRLKSDMESVRNTERAINELKANRHVRAVVPALVDAEGTTRYAQPGRVVVRFIGVSQPDVRTYLEEIGAQITREFRTPGFVEIQAPAGVGLPVIIDTLNQHANLLFAEPSFYGFGDQEPQIQFSEPGQATSTSSSLPWNLIKLGLPGAWARTTGVENIVVCVIDGLPEESHEAVAAKFIAPPAGDRVFSEGAALSPHATGIASVIAGESGGFAGVAPGVRILPLVVNLNSQAYAERADAILMAAHYARTGDVDGESLRRLILVCSWRTRGDVTMIRTALAAAVAAAALVVCSAGNDNSDGAHFPSDYAALPGSLGQGLVAVAGTDESDAKASYSNYSPTVDLSAPGGDGMPLGDGDIHVADLGGTYGYAAGTSFAVPHVAGVAALVLSLAPDLPVAELKRLLKDSSEDIAAWRPNYDGLLGTGRLRADWAVAAAPVQVPPPELDTPGADVARRLRDCADSIEAETGWRIVAVELARDGSNATIGLE